MQEQPARRARQAARKREESSPQRLGGDERFLEADAAGPAREVVGQRLQREPGRVRAEATGGQVREADAVLEVADGVLDLGVTAVIALKGERVALAIGDEDGM